MAVSSILNRLPRLAGNHSWTPLLVGGLFLGVGALVGLVVATGNLILIALVLGGIAGVLLLNALPIAVWLILIGVFLINGPVGYFSPGMAKISWLFSLLGIFMAGAAMLYTVAGSKHFQRPMPPFIYTSLAFIVLAVASGLMSDGPITEVAAGAKRYFQFWGVMFLMAVVPFSEKQVRNWLLFILGVGLMQLPFTLYQRVVLVPGVMGYDKPGFVPFDIIVGTFEGSMTGGGASSIMAMLQVMVLFAVFYAWREKLLNGFWTLLLTVALLVPLGLGETKVVLIMMPVVLFAAYFDLVAKRPLAFLGIVVATLFFGAILGYFYFVVQTSGDIANMSFDENLRDTIEYNFGNRGYYATGVNRLTAVPYWFESQSWNDPIATLFGTGVGSSYGVDGLVPDPGHMFLAHPGMYIDLLTTSTVLWDFGIVGFILYFMIIFGAMRSVAKCFAEATTAWDRLLCRMLMSSLAVTLLMAVYSNSAVVLVSHAFIVSLTLGLVAWRYRHGPMSPTRADLLKAGKPSRFKPDFRHTKVIFPTEGVLAPQELAWQQQRLLASKAAEAGEQPAQEARHLGYSASAGQQGSQGQGAAADPSHAVHGQQATSAFAAGAPIGGAAAPARTGAADQSHAAHGQQAKPAFAAGTGISGAQAQASRPQAGPVPGQPSAPAQSVPSAQAGQVGQSAPYPAGYTAAAPSAPAGQAAPQRPMSQQPMNPQSVGPQAASSGAAGTPGGAEMTAAQAMANLATAGQSARSAFPKAQGAQAQADAAPRQPASAPVAQGPVGQTPVGQAPAGQGMSAAVASSPAAPRMQPPGGMGAAAPRRAGIGQPGPQIPPSSVVSRGPQPGVAQRAPSQVAQPPQQRQAAQPQVTQPQVTQPQVTQPQVTQPQATQPQGPVSAPSQPRFPQAPAARQQGTVAQPQQPYSSPVRPSHVAPDAGMPSRPAFGEGVQHHRRARHTGHFGPRPQHLDLANPSAWGAPEQGADLPPTVGTRRPSPQQGMPGEPTIDDVAGPRTLPMFADDDDPDNGKDRSSRRSGWLDTRDSSRRR